MGLAPLEPDRRSDQDRLLRCRQVEQVEIPRHHLLHELPEGQPPPDVGPFFLGGARGADRAITRGGSRAKTMPFQPEIAASLKILFEPIAEMEGRQRDASLSQVWRTPSDRLCQFLLTTSQFTIGRCSALLWVAEAD
jgi:hypothetical protein